MYICVEKACSKGEDVFYTFSYLAALYSVNGYTKQNFSH